MPVYIDLDSSTIRKNSPNISVNALKNPKSGNSINFINEKVSKEKIDILFSPLKETKTGNTVNIESLEKYKQEVLIGITYPRSSIKE